ncbi:MAG TPA: PIG-L family deacetylase [Chthonomonadales bacterium]|nr:PIG-L family deacetylase [Chthonomonadales bacterium]
MPEITHARPLFRILLVAAAVPFVYVAGAFLGFSYRHHAANASPLGMRLSPAPFPRQGTRLLVFAPHCDDETLGCGGLMQRTLTLGGSVRVVILTNGDAFRVAVQRQVRSLRVVPKDYVNFATMRQQESLRALEHLGVPRSSVLFFGYPDRGLTPMWNSHWSPASPFLSSYTRADRSPYADTFDPTASYCGEDAVTDIESEMRQFKPTLVCVTHPAEDHPDHTAAAAMVTTALLELRSEPAQAGWARRAQLAYYLVHRGDWPAPQGLHLADPLTPPAEMLHVDTHWMSLALTPAERSAKLQSIRMYHSQMVMMARFLLSFARSTELFGVIDPETLPAFPYRPATGDQPAVDWNSVKPLLLDPLRDTLLRDLQGGGDIKAAYLCRDSRYLYARLEMRLPVSSRISYTMRIRAFGSDGRSSMRTLDIRFRSRAGTERHKSGDALDTKGNILEAAIPWSRIRGKLSGSNAKMLAVGAETYIGNLEIDHTGVRFVIL